MSWVAVAIGGAGLAAGGAIASATAGNDKVDNSWLQNPEYPHSQDARDLWWSKLQDWGKDPNYGSVSPDWENIWNTVQRQVKQHYEGGPLEPGVQDKVSSSLARRNMSDNPASDFLHARIAGQEGNTLADAATAQAQQKVDLTNSGRNTWLQSLENFQAQKPAGQWQTTITEPTQRKIGDAISGIGSSAASLGLGIYGSQQTNSALNGLLKQQSAPQGFAPLPQINAFNYQNASAF